MPPMGRPLARIVRYPGLAVFVQRGAKVPAENLCVEVTRARDIGGHQVRPQPSTRRSRGSGRFANRRPFERLRRSDAAADHRQSKDHSSPCVPCPRHPPLLMGTAASVATPARRAACTGRARVCSRQMREMRWAAMRMDARRVARRRVAPLHKRPDKTDAAFRPNPAGRPMAGALRRCCSLVGVSQRRSRRLALPPAIGLRTPAFSVNRPWCLSNFRHCACRDCARLTRCAPRSVARREGGPPTFRRATDLVLGASQCPSTWRPASSSTRPLRGRPRSKRRRLGQRVSSASVPTASTQSRSRRRSKSSSCWVAMRRAC